MKIQQQSQQKDDKDSNLITSNFFINEQQTNNRDRSQEKKRWNRDQYSRKYVNHHSHNYNIGKISSIEKKIPKHIGLNNTSEKSGKNRTILQDYYNRSHSMEKKRKSHNGIEYASYHYNSGV